MEKRLVLPGDKLCTLEEYLPKSGAKALKDGTVVATVAGYVNYEKEKHEVSVEPLKGEEKPTVGDIVLCEVREVQDKLIWCDIIARTGRPFRNKWNGVIIAPATLEEEPFLTVGDLVVARVEKEISGMYNLTIRERELGCVIAFCDSCGSFLRMGRQGLVCIKCKRTYRRKMVGYYGNHNRVLEKFGTTIILK